MTLRLALPDDALREPTLELLAAAGVAIDAATTGGAADHPGVAEEKPLEPTAAALEPVAAASAPTAARLVVVAAADVPAYLACGAAELGVMAKTALLEGGAGLCELLDLRFGASLLVYATAPGAAARGQRLGRLRIATRHPHLARSYFVSRGVQIAVVEVAGELDRAVRDGLADGMVTLAGTAPGAGPPAQVAGLDVVGVVAEGGARLVAARGGRVLHAAAIGALVGRLRGALAERMPA